MLVNATDSTYPKSAPEFLCDNIRLNRFIIVSPDTDVTVISLH